MKKLKYLSKHEMPREKLIEMGVENLRDLELMAILLRTGVKGKDVLEISKEILAKFPKSKLLTLDFDKLSKIKGIGAGKACLLLAAFELVKRALEVEDNNLPYINSAQDAVAQLQELCDAKKEHFVALYLNARDQLICKETISIGTIDSNLIHPREIFKPAIDCLSSSLIIAHNHPSGDNEPSIADTEITNKLVNAGKILDIKVVDHIIVTKNNWKSMKESNLMG